MNKLWTKNSFILDYLPFLLWWTNIDFIIVLFKYLFVVIMKVYLDYKEIKMEKIETKT